MAKVSGKVYVLGTAGLLEELDKEGISHVGFGVGDLALLLAFTETS